MGSYNQGFLQTAVFTTSGIKTRGYYIKGCYNQGFLQSGVLELGESDDGDDFN